MPPNPTGAGATTIIRPGDQRIVDANGKVTQFGSFNVISDRSQILEDLGIILGFYGMGGNGKTTLACSIADRNLNPEGHDLPMAILDAEAGIKSVAHLIGPDLQRIPILGIERLEEFVRTARATPKNTFPWKTLMLDNVSDFVLKALRAQGFHGQSGTTSQPDWNAVNTRITIILQDFRDLCLDYGVNMIFMLWERPERDGQGNIVGRRADLPPQLGIRVQGILDYIGYLTVLNDPPRYTRKLDFSPNPELDSKMRTIPKEQAASVPFELYNPSLPDILNSLKRGVPFPKDKYKKPVNPVTGR